MNPKNASLSMRPFRLLIRHLLVLADANLSWVNYHLLLHSATQRRNAAKDFGAVWLADSRFSLRGCEKIVGVQALACFVGQKAPEKAR